jgi:hypothetical protein
LLRGAPGGLKLKVTVLPTSPARDTFIPPLCHRIGPRGPSQTEADGQLVIQCTPADELPLVLAGRFSPALQTSTESLYRGVAEMFERRVARRRSCHTERAYRRNVFSFVVFLGIRCHRRGGNLLRATLAKVQLWREGTYGKKTKLPRVSTAASARYRASIKTWLTPTPRREDREQHGISNL